VRSRLRQTPALVAFQNSLEGLLDRLGKSHHLNLTGNSQLLLVGRALTERLGEELPSWITKRPSIGWMSVDLTRQCPYTVSDGRKTATGLRVD
jgi:hypothetical protein